MKWPFAKGVLGVAISYWLSGCAGTQVSMTSLEMAEQVARIREVQVLRNISAAISDHDSVPSQILLGTGQANVAAGAATTVKLPHFDFSQNGREVDITGTNTWTAQWQFESVTNADDLRRLRNLYALVSSDDKQWYMLQAYFDRHPEARDPFADAEENESPPLGYGPGKVINWHQAVAAMKRGDSIGCKLFQENRSAPSVRDAVSAAKGDNKQFPFRRWLYWRHPGSPGWLPNKPDLQVQPLGRYGEWELGVTSRPCFDDFVILVQGATPAAEKAGAAGAKVMLTQ